MNPVGIIQGRLSPPSLKRLQAFPWESWEQEFERARTCGFEGIEWLFEAEGFSQNPIWSDTGIEGIQTQIARTGVPVCSCCADFFLEHPFVRVSESEAASSAAVLERLIEQAAAVGVGTVLLPVLEVAELRTPGEKAQLLRYLRAPLDLAAEHGVRVGLETELPAGEYADLVGDAGHPALGAYFDTGNATARGYDMAADIRILAPFLCGIHVKDRKTNGPSVALGEGDADFRAFFAAVRTSRYAGPVVLQTIFGRDFLGMARAHLNFVKNLL